MPVPYELSVVIATRNRRELLERCIRALCSQTQDPETFEVVVADDDSADGPAEMLDGIETPFQLRHLKLARVGRAAARNAGIEAAGGGVCLILDDDVVAEPELVAEHLGAHRQGRRLLGIGRITQALPSGRDWYARNFAKSWNRHYEGLEGGSVDWTAAYGGNLSVPREALIEVGGFATPELPVGQDIELAYRLWRAGCGPTYIPAAHGIHDDQKPRAGLLRDSRLQGAAAVELAEREPAMLPATLGWYGATSTRELLLRRAMLALRVPAGALAALGPAIPGEGRQQLWFDFVRRFAYWRAVRRSVDGARWAQISRGVPVLMYHAFDSSRSSERFIVSRRSFARQMRILALLRRRVISFEELAQGLRNSRLPPPRAVVITIDDGYADNHAVALPVLRRRRFPATVFLVSERIGGRNDWTAEGALRDRALLTLEQMVALESGGVQLGAHTRTHRPLTDLGGPQVSEEVQGSRGDLERVLGHPVAVFAYPFGRYDSRSIEAVRGAGFAGACTTEPHLARLDDDPALIPRIEIRGSDSLPRFLRKLWLGGP